MIPVLLKTSACISHEVKACAQAVEWFRPVVCPYGPDGFFSRRSILNTASYFSKYPLSIICSGSLFNYFICEDLYQMQNDCRALRGLDIPAYRGLRRKEELGKWNARRPSSSSFSLSSLSMPCDPQVGAFVSATKTSPLGSTYSHRG